MSNKHLTQFYSCLYPPSAQTHQAPLWEVWALQNKEHYWKKQFPLFTKACVSYQAGISVIQCYFLPGIYKLMWPFQTSTLKMPPSYDGITKFEICWGKWNISYQNGLKNTGCAHVFPRNSHSVGFSGFFCSADLQTLKHFPLDPPMSA